jgi:hypothetical protein
MEQRSAELADLVYSPSRYLLDWVRDEGWRLPEAVACHPNLLPRGFVMTPARAEARPVEELVFFGRLEERKGLDLFCAAVSLLVRGGVRPACVTFLGKVGEMGGADALRWIAAAAHGWGVPWAVRNELDVLGARDFLAQPGRLAVIASVAENSPYTVLECIAAGTPFLAPMWGAWRSWCTRRTAPRCCSRGRRRRWRRGWARCWRRGRGRRGRRWGSPAMPRCGGRCRSGPCCWRRVRRRRPGGRWSRSA